MGNCCVAPIDKSKYTSKNEAFFERLEHESPGDYFSGTQVHPDDRLKEELSSEFGVKKRGSLADIEVKQEKKDFRGKLGKIAKAQKKAVEKILKDDFTLKRRVDFNDEVKARYAKCVS